MSLSPSKLPPTLAPQVAATLQSLRTRVRQYVWLEGLASGAAWLGIAFWGSLAADWFFEPTTSIRLGVLLFTSIVLGAVLIELIGRRAFVPLSDSSMATVQERRFPQLNDNLLTAVVLTGRPSAPDECDPEMLARTCEEAAQRVGDVELARVFNPRPLRRSVTAAMLLATSIVLLTTMFPAVTGIWARRNLLMAEELWPRRTRLLVEGFPDGVVKVARGADLEIIAKADATKPQVPQSVQIRYWTEGGGRARATMNRVGNFGPSDPFQQYTYTFRSLLASLRFDVAGGDDAVRGLRIEVVDSPAIVEMSLECRYPAYTDLAPRTLPVTGVMQIPMGTQVTVVARTNKELVRVQVDHAAEQEASASHLGDATASKAMSQHSPPSPPAPLPQAGEGRSVGEVPVPIVFAPDHRGFRHSLDPLVKDQTLLFTLFDADGVRSREPVRLALVTLADEAPQLAVRLAGIGTAITPQARLPAVGRVTDDYGLARLWFETAVDQKPQAARAIADPPKNSTELKLDAALEARDLKLTPGQKFLVGVKAADRCTLGHGPNVGASEQWLLDVVTPEQLRSMLQARELVLRQRFEAIVQEVTETRDLLARVGHRTPRAGKAEKADSDLDHRTGDASRTASPSLAMDALSVERAIQTARKNAHETLSVAEAFDDLRLQLINNRIDTEEWKRRLADGIANPLRQVGEKMFPELDRLLLVLKESLADQHEAVRYGGQARQQVEEILVAMRKVLDRMLEMEDFNEAVELLRAIIKQQEQIGDQTKQRHKQKLRELLED